MAVLSNLQYELDGVVFGRGTNYLVQHVNFNDANIITNDAQFPRSDHMVFGRDYRQGMTVIFDMVLHKDRPSVGEGRDLLAVLKKVWRNDSGRKIPNTVVPLRMNRHGIVSRVYGRPRSFMVDRGRIDRAYVPITAEFQCVDDLWYDDEEESNSIAIVPAAVGGLSSPLSAPLTSTGVGEKEGEISVGGDTDTWIVATIHGPITNPEIDALGQWKLKLLTTISNGDYVTVDSRPWSRGVLRNNVANVAGSITQDSPRLEEMKLPPGDHQVVLRGSDGTGTAWIEYKWRKARSIG